MTTSVLNVPGYGQTDPGTSELPRLRLIARVREASRSAFHILRTGEHEVANALLEGIDLGMDVGLGIAKDKYQSALGGIPAQRTGGAR